MKKTFIFLLPVLLMNLSTEKIIAQNAGNNTTTSNAIEKLHVETGTSLTDGILVDGTFNTTGSVPDLGPGSRMMFYPGKAAFRAGTANGLQWNNANVGGHSAAFGYGTKASNANSFAAGFLAEATGENSLSIGFTTKARGFSSVAFGEEAWAFGHAATAMGSFTLALGGASTAMGFTTQSNGEASTAMGTNTIASGNYSTSMGQNTNARSAASVAMGRFNDTFATSKATIWVYTDPLLILGNGTSDAARSNALVVYKNGNTDINGYTKLGKTSEAAPAIKMKNIMGTGPAVNGSRAVAHGLDASKIISVQIFMQYGTSPVATKTLPPNYTLSNNLEYQYEIAENNIVISNKVGNSANIGGKPFRMLITYQD